MKGNHKEESEDSFSLSEEELKEELYNNKT